jgi:predicted Zn-dependent protease
MRLGRAEEAVGAFRTSLHWRPDSPLTQLSLGHALRQIGRDAEAADAWNECLRAARDGPLAAEAQRQLHALGRGQ